MTKKKVSLLEFENNPNIGLYMFANDKFCIIGEKLEKAKQEQIEDILQVPVYVVSTLSTSLVGVFVTGNNDYLFIPEIQNHEKEEFEKIAKKHDMKLITLTNRLNTLGNNICVGADTLIVNDEYSEKFIESIQKETKYKIIKLEHDKYKAAGAMCKYLNGKYFVSQELNEQDVYEIIKQVAGVGTVNSGSNFIASGMIGNKNGILIGSLSSTIEIQNIVESLEYI